MGFVKNFNLYISFMKNQENIDQDLMKRSEYEASYRELGNDDYIMSIAEEGLEDYSDQLKDVEK